MHVPEARKGCSDTADTSEGVLRRLPEEHNTKDLGSNVKEFKLDLNLWHSLCTIPRTSLKQIFGHSMVPRTLLKQVILVLIGLRTGQKSAISKGPRAAAANDIQEILIV